jgi:hypothetical protein
MPETAIANLFHIQDRFLRSAHLERDFADASSLNGYVLTPPIRSNLERLTIGLTRNSGQRAWRITGDYGSGKSSFGLVLAHLFGGQIDQLPTNLRRIIDFKKLGAVRPQLLPVLVTGSREPMAGAFLRSLHTALLEAYSRGRMPKLFGEIEEQLKLAPSGSVPDAAVVEILVKANAYISESGKGTGLLVIIDELGKFLEYAALHPDRQDIYLLQKLAEVAARSGETPLFIVGLLHQGFNAYADSLSQSAQKEWEKVAGRFEEILFNQPMDQIANLVINALNIRAKQLPESIIKQAQQGMRAALDIGWYGVASHAELIESAARLYPLHPTVLPVLVKLLSRFGQNERSLFSFLLSNEPFGLQDFSAQLVAPNCFYRIHNLYDYARTTFGHRLSIQSYRSHWNQIDSMIESFSTDDVVDLQILKTVGLLNMLDANNLLASEQAIKSAIFGEGAIAQRTASTKVHDLQRGKRVLYYRGAAGGYCLWPHTSINLEKAYEDASQALGTSQRISSLIQNYLETRPVVARRHYIQTGNLRHFSVHYLPTAELDTALNVPTDGADGVIIIPLCETEEERLHALRFAESEGLKDRPEVLVAVPRPLGNLAGLVQEAQRWQWIAENTAELNADTFAAEEVTRQIAASRQMLEKRVHAFIGLKQFTGKTELLWFRLCQLLEISNGRELLSYLSNVCDEVYKRAPRILNELVNRNSLSSAASAARMRVIERMFKSSTEPLLGMDPTKKPPEMSIYLSVLRSAGLHQDVGDSHALIVPEAKADSCNVRPALQHIQRVLEKRPDKRIKISEVLAELRRPPFGIRDGVSAILLAAFAVINEQDVAFYENGSFMRHVEGFDFLRLTKNPEAFEIQYCKIAGVRSELFDRMLKILRLKSSNKRKLDLLDVVRPLCVFAAQLPAYTHKTKKLSEQSIAVRTELVSAREPATLLFHQLPQACGYSGFPVNGSIESSEVRDFVISLKDALDELKAAFPELQDRMKATVAKAFDVSGTFQEVREALSARAENILITVSEMQLKAFCLRLRDRNLPEAEWLESLGSMICSMPPSKWTDEEEELFGQELNQLASRFLRVESMSFKTRKSAHTSSAVRVAITQIDGSEIDQVIYTTEDEEKAVLKLESQLTSMFRQNKKIVLAATARAFWKALSQEEEKKHVQTSASHPEFVWGEG